MWLFISKKIRTWLLLTVGLPLTRRAVHRLAVAADRHDESARTAGIADRPGEAAVEPSTSFTSSRSSEMSRSPDPHSAIFIAHVSPSGSFASH